MTDLVNQVICGDSAQELKKLPDGLVDLTVTSPPYDDIRTYDGYSFDFPIIAKELFRLTKDGGVLVWIIRDQRENGSESGTSLEQALFLKRIGFNLHDTMIYEKAGIEPPHDDLYHQVWEYMFVFSKGKPKTHNLIRDHKNKDPIRVRSAFTRDKNGEKHRKQSQLKTWSVRRNIWTYPTGRDHTTKDYFAFEHPAIFPEQLAKDHIISWSNEGDLVLDPFAGAGTTLKMAKLLNRNYIGIEISKKYCDLIQRRLQKHNNQRLESFVAIHQ